MSGPAFNTRSKTRAKSTIMAESILSKFDPANVDDPLVWYEQFERYGQLKKWEDTDTPKFLPLWLTGAAMMWYATLPQATKDSKDQLKTAFTARFEPHTSIRWSHIITFDNRTQQAGESVESYAADLQFLNKKIANTDDRVLKDRFVLGLRPSIRSYVMLKAPATFTDAYGNARECSMIPEAPILATTTPFHAPDLQEQINAISDKLDKIQLQPASPSHSRRVHFRSPDRRSPSPNYGSQCGRCLSSNHTSSKCWCFTKKIVCHKCKKIGHISKACRSVRPQSPSTNNQH